MRRSKFLRLTQFVKDNLKECRTPNKPEININSPDSTNIDINLSSAYIFKDIFNENNEIIAKKVLSVIDEKMTPILCVGENEKDIKEGKALLKIKTQG